MKTRIPTRLLVITALVGAIAAAVALSVWALWYLPYGRQMWAASHVEARGGMVEIEPGGLQWLRTILGDRWAADVLEVQFINRQEITDDDLRRVSAFRNLESLRLVNAPRVTDAGLHSLRKLTALESFHVGAVPITDRGLGDLKHFTALRELTIQEADVTDAGIEVIGELGKLERLGLYDLPQLTDSCIASVARLDQLRHLELIQTGITEAGLGRLSSLKELRSIRFGKVRRSPSEDHLMEVLDREMPIKLDNAPLRDVLEYLSEFLEVTIAVDEEAMAEKGIDLAAAITCDSSATVQAHLKSMLEPLDLCSFMESDKLWITTRAGASRRVPGILKLQLANPDLKVQWKL